MEPFPAPTELVGIQPFTKSFDPITELLERGRDLDLL
jgi:hypothetical protein